MASPEVLENRQHLGSAKKVTFEEESSEIRRRRTPPPRYPHRKSFRKRSHSFTEGSFKKAKTSDNNVLPSKFLLGGNIRDPLNLNSLSDERISEIVNAITPESSPLPTPKHRKAEYKIRVLIPPNITDPLNLNAGVDEREYESRLRKKIRHRKRASTTSKREDLPHLPPPKAPSAKLSSASTSTSAAKTAPSSKEEAAAPVPQDGGNKTEGGGVEGEGDEDAKQEKPVVNKEDPSGGSPQAKKRALDSANPVVAAKSHSPKFKAKNKKFQYGNYNRYYGYRKPTDSIEEDLRIRFLKPEWYRGKKVLDIGCNVGKLTDIIARLFRPKNITGIDIDKDLVNVARKNLRKGRDSKVVSEFPKSMSILYGSIGTTLEGDDGDYPNNLGFLCANYVLDSDALLETMQPEFDTIMCFSTTKWIHLNFGDEGIKRTFKRIYAQLHPGGKFILEAQGFTSYRKKKKLTQRIFENFKKIKLRPESFGDFLINEVGFESRELVAIPQHPSRGFQRPIQVFTKPSMLKTPTTEQLATTSSKKSPTVANTNEGESQSKEKNISKPGSSSSSSASSPSVSNEKSAEKRAKLCKPSTSKSKVKVAPKSSPYYSIGSGPTPPGRTPSIGMTPQYDLGTPCYNPEELDIPPGGYYGYNTPGITPGYSGPSPDGYSNIDHIPPIQRHHSPVYTGPPPGTFSGASTPGNDEPGYTPHYSGYTPSYEGGASTSNNGRRNVYTYSPGNATPSPRTSSAPGTPNPHASPGTPNSHTSPGTPNPHASPGTPNPHASPGPSNHQISPFRSSRNSGNQLPNTATTNSNANSAQSSSNVNGGVSSHSTSNSGVTTTASTSATLVSPQIQQSEISGNTTPHPGTSISPANSDQHRYLWYGCSSSGGTTPQSGIEDPSSSPKVVCPSPLASTQEGIDSNPSTPVSDERPESASP